MTISDDAREFFDSRNGKLIGGVAILVVLIGAGFGLSQTSTPRTSPAEQPDSEARQPGQSSGLPGGDIPDGSKWLTYTSSKGSYSVVYPQGWMVNKKNNGGVLIKDSDSSENVTMASAPGNLTRYVRQNGLPQLRNSIESFKSKSVKKGKLSGNNLVQVTYTGKAVMDQVTGKKRDIIGHRFYIEGPNNKMAVMTLTRPQNVDNVDAFKRMISNFKWG